MVVVFLFRLEKFEEGDNEKNYDNGKHDFDMGEVLMDDDLLVFVYSDVHLPLLVGKLLEICEGRNP